MLKSDPHIVRKFDVLPAVVDREVLMMHIPSGNYYGLNPVASFIWMQLEEPRRVTELVRAVSETFSVPFEVCKADVEFFLEDMIKDGLMDVKAG